MKTIAFLSACSLSFLIAACATAPIPPPAASVPPAAAPLAVPPAAPAPRSGLNLPGFDKQVRPGDDLYRYTVGTWLATTPIPADRSNWSAGAALAEQSERDIHAILEELAQRQYIIGGSEEQKVGELYRSFLDRAAQDAAGLAPLQSELQRIAALRTRRDVVAFLGHVQQIGSYPGVAWSVQTDAHNTNAYIGYLSQAGLSMSDRDYYLKDDATYVRYRKAFSEYVATLLRAAGDPAPESSAATVLKFETQLARLHWTKVQNRDPVKTYNKVTIAELTQLAPQIDWPLFLQSAGAPQEALVVAQPTYLAGFAKLLAATPVADWRTWLRYRLIDDKASYLGTRFDTANFAFYQQTLQGVKEQAADWKRAIQLIDTVMGEATGKLYVAKRFTPEARARMQQLVANLLEAFRLSIDELEWMSPTTRAEAHRKLAAYTVKIGYPDRWRDYGALQISPTDLAGNVLRYERYEFGRRLARIHEPVDRSEWEMTPQTVNAYYQPVNNEIVFPAGILQPPYFDPGADDAVNYGSIGAVIGHEISHGFDDQGRQYDATGNLRDWWTPEDAARFKALADRLDAQYSAYTVLDGQHLNGRFTLGENIADLSGLAVSWRAYQIARAKALPVQDLIDGFTGAQRFFLGYAQGYERVYREDNIRWRLTSDPHSLSEFRANGVVTHLQAFHDAFAVAPGDKLYRAPADRVKIW